MQTVDTTIHFLDLADGRIVYDDNGTGPLVICVPGLGDIRATYRFLGQHWSPQVIVSLRWICVGHGDSTVGWASYADTAIGDDVLALMQALNAGPAILLGNSYGGSAVAYVVHAIGGSDDDNSRAPDWFLHHTVATHSHRPHTIALPCRGDAGR